MLDANISIVESTYEMLSIDESDTMIKVELDETITYKMDGIIQNESIKHDIMLMYNDEGGLVVVSDGYLEEFSEFASASYVPNYSTYAFGAGSGNCVVTVAESQIGYLEKKTNSNLESFTANAGTKNFTKYGAWTGTNGEAWCASFVSWCANQAQVSTSVITKTASCDESMDFFKIKGQFYDSPSYGGTYRPLPGDIFFLGNSQDKATHTWVDKTSYYQCSICGETATTIPITPAAHEINE